MEPRAQSPRAQRCFRIRKMFGRHIHVKQGFKWICMPPARRRSLTATLRREREGPAHSLGGSARLRFERKIKKCMIEIENNTHKQINDFRMQTNKIHGLSSDFREFPTNFCQVLFSSPLLLGDRASIKFQHKSSRKLPNIHNWRFS